MDSTFYRAVASRITYAEAWRATRSLLEFVLLAVVKTLRIPIARHLGYASEPLQRLDWEAMGDEARASLESDRRRWSELGLRYCFCYSYPRVGPHQERTLVMQSPDGALFLKVGYEMQAAGTIRTVVKSTWLITRLTDGRVLVTCDRGDVFPPDFKLAIVRWRPEGELLRVHRDRIAGALPASPIVLLDEAQLEREIIEQNRAVFEYAVRRGVLVAMTEDELRRAQESSLPEESAAPVHLAELVETPAGALTEIPVAEVVPAPPVYSSDFAFVDDPAASKHPNVLAEIDKIQNKKAGGLSGLAILAVSVALFVVLGGLNWDWKFVLLLIPILLFHESGHFIAMRVFRYRNVRMFFIPLFGAAVTGQHYNVPGWKKAIVSLAGPMPGILVGACLGLAAIAMHDHALLMEAAALTVFLNAMNLLPFLPLDGGWVMHALVFSRHYWLDIGFRLVTALALLASGFLGMTFLAIVGVFMLLGLPSIYRIARIAAHLRESGMPTISPDGKTIPTRTADEIIDQVQAAFPSALTDNLKARFALQVFENINSRPPGILASLALGGAYGAGIVAGIGFFVFLTVARFTALGEIPAP
jgi:Zn-dependent protease